MSPRLNTRRIALSTVALATGVLLMLGGGIAQASYIKSGEFSVGKDARGLAVDQSSGAFSGYVYTSEEAGNAEVSQFTPSTFARSATFGNGTDFSGVAVDPSTGEVYALDSEHGVVDEFEASAASGSGPSTTVGSGTITAGDNARIWVDASGDVFVPDSAKNVVDEFSSSGTLAREIGGAGVLHEPTAVAVDSNGNVYVVDTKPPVVAGEATSGRVQEFSSTGTLEGVLGEGVLSSAQGVTVDTVTNEVIVIDDRTSETQLDAFEASLESSPGIFSPGSLRLKSVPGEIPYSGVFYGIGVAPSSGDVYVAEYGVFFGTAKIFVPAEGPKATTLGSEAVTAVGARVNGLVNPNGFDTHWHFEYGLSQSYGQDSPLLPGEDAGSEASTRSVTSVLSGLQPDKVYHYQLIAENQNGTGEGGDQTLTTPAARPSVDGQSSSEITRSTATVNAQINPNNQDTHYYFQYGTDTGYALGSVPVAPGVDIGSEYGDKTENASLGELAPNTLYHYRVVAVNATGTSDGLDHTFTTVPDAPSVATGVVSAIGQSSGTLTGTIDPQGALASYYFEYSGPGVFSFISGEAGAGSGPVTVTAPVQDLSAGTTYQYRLVVSSAGGTIFGAYQTFTTQPSLAGAPGVTTGGVSNIEPGAAQLEGTVNPQGGPTSYHFDYGAGTAYGASAPVPGGSIASFIAPEVVSLSLGGLAPGVVYHYRLVASNADGTSYGADQTFTTPAASVSAFGPPPVNTLAPTTTTKSTTSKALTRAQKLSNALKACKKRPKKQRTACVRQARKQYGPKPKAKARKR